MADFSICERMLAVRKVLDLSQKDFAKGIYLSTSFYAKIEIGHRNPNERVFELISVKYNVNKDWLKTGKGQMFNKNTPPDVELNQLIEIINELDPYFRDYLIQQIKQLAKLHRISKEKGQDPAPKAEKPPQKTRKPQ